MGSDHIPVNRHLSNKFVDFLFGSIIMWLWRRYPGGVKLENDMATISFSVRKDEARVIHKIAQRAVSLALANGVSYEFMDADMDITAVHVNACPLRLDDLLQADEFNFIHDVFGIRRHLNRETGKLEDCFCPRFSA